MQNAVTTRMFTPRHSLWQHVAGVIAVLCVMVCLTPDALAQPGGGPPPAQVVFGEARLENVEQRRPVTGELRTNRRSVLATQEEGLVREVHFDAGDRVEAGTVIARLDDRLRRLDLEAAKAVVMARESSQRELQAQFQDAQLDLERLVELEARASASPRELDQARTLVDASRARLASDAADLLAAQVEVRRAETRLQNLTISAPFRGVVLDRRTEVGQWLNQGDAVVEVVALDVVEAWIDVPESSLARLSIDSDAGSESDEKRPEIRVFVAAIGREVQSTVYSLVPQVDPLSRQFPVRVMLQNDDWLLRPGMSCTGLIPTGREAEHTTVPKDALLRDDGGEYLYFEAGGVAAVARVSRLFGFGDRVAIRPGAVPPGSRVIVRGNERVFPGQPLIELADSDILSGEAGRGQGEASPEPSRTGG